MRLDLSGVAAIVLLAVAMNGSQVQKSSGPYKPIQPSDGRVFPAKEAALLKLRDEPSAPNIAKMRKHAWDLFVGLTKGDPAWETWYTKCDVKLAAGGCPSPPAAGSIAPQRLFTSFEIPAQSLQFLEQLYIPPGPADAGQTSRQQGPGFQTELQKFITEFEKHPQFASVLFNEEAAHHILAECLYPQAADIRLGVNPACPTDFKDHGEIPAFERGSIVLKTVWEVAHMNSKKGRDLAGPIDTWNSALWNEVHSGDVDPSSFAKRLVMIDTGKSAKCRNRDYGDDEKVPLGCFYSYKLMQADIDAFPHILSAVNVHHFVPGDYLILVGMHVTTKEIPQWVWATFWWDNHAFSDSHKSGRPSTLGQKWRHFLMETTLSGFTPIEKDGGPKIAFNPYLETKITNGIISNCLQCHDEAAYGSQSTINPYELGILSRDGRTLASGKPLDPGYPHGGVRTDFIWSIADAQNPKTKSLLGLLETELK